MPAATILIPTFDHAELLRYAVASALAQTIDDVEVFVVGDGVGDNTREVVAALQREDERVRFFDLPKGPRHGELNRHRALTEARGDAVCYLSDDDLYLPGHVESVLAALEAADVVHAQPLWVEASGNIRAYLADLSLPFHRDLLFAGENRVSLSFGAHSLALYRRLPHGWRTTPAGVSTDHYMWQQLLADSATRAAPTFAATVLNFPAPLRATWSNEERVAELARWWGRTQEPHFAKEYGQAAQHAVLTTAAEAETRLVAATAALEGAEAIAARREAEAAARVAAAYEATLTFRLRRSILAIPLARHVARARSRLGGRDAV